MAYLEENGQVVLTMSTEDYKRLLLVVKANVGIAGKPYFEWLDRLNSGNPHYTPYQVAGAESKKEPTV